MRLNRHEKQIIRKIASGKVYDIVSYLEAFNLTTLRKLDKESAKKRLEELENGATYQALKRGSKEKKPITITPPENSRFSNLTYYEYESDTIEYVPASLSYTNAKLRITNLKGEKYTYDYVNGVNCVNSFNEVMRFLVIWQYLKSNGLVLETDKETNRNDYEIFFEYKPIEKTTYYKYAVDDSGNSDELFGLSVEDDPNRLKDFRNYIDYFIEYNQANEKCCQQYIDKQIIAGPDLDLFIRCHFHTKEQIFNILSLVSAYAALFITLVTTVCQGCSNEKDTQKIYEHLSAIETQLKDASENAISSADLENIENQLEALQKYDDSSISSKLDEIIKNLDNIKAELQNEN